MGPRTGLDDVEKRKMLSLLTLELRPLGRPALSQSVYRLRYLGSRYYYYVSLCALCTASFNHLDVIP
jgi:hypothetical protein